MNCVHFTIVSFTTMAGSATPAAMADTIMRKDAGYVRSIILSLQTHVDNRTMYYGLAMRKSMIPMVYGKAYMEP